MTTIKTMSHIGLFLSALDNKKILNYIKFDKIENTND